MKIESLIKRDGGTVVEMDSESYSFLPNKSGSHVCDVENPEHIEKLLAITEGFAEVVEVVDKKEKKPKVGE